MSDFNMETFKQEIERNLKVDDWKVDKDEGALMLLELMVKRQNGSYNSHTEERFLNSMKVLSKNNTPTKLGKQFMMKMLYNHSNLRPLSFEAMSKYRY